MAARKSTKRSFYLKSDKLKLEPQKEIGLEKTDDPDLCKLCPENKQEVVFVPCDYLISCKTCVAALELCAVCREPTSQKVKVYKC